MHGKRPYLIVLSTVVVLCWLSYRPPAGLLQAPSTECAVPARAPTPAAIGGTRQVDRIEPVTGHGDDFPAQHDWHAATCRLARKYKKFATHGPKRYDDPQGAMAFHVEQRLPAGSNRLPLEHLRRVRSNLARREQANQNLRGTSVQTITGWSSIGPGNVGGRTRALAIDPVNPNNMYAAGVAGGVWKSTDAGDSWAPADDFMLNPGLPIDLV